MAELFNFKKHQQPTTDRGMWLYLRVMSSDILWGTYKQQAHKLVKPSVLYGFLYYPERDTKDCTWDNLAKAFVNCGGAPVSGMELKVYCSSPVNLGEEVAYLVTIPRASLEEFERDGSTTIGAPDTYSRLRTWLADRIAISMIEESKPRSKRVRSRQTTSRLPAKGS